MKDAASLADSIVVNIEKTSSYVKNNWKNALIVIWMMVATVTLIKQQQAINKVSTHNQVANMDMAVKDVRYSVEAMEGDVEKMQRAVTKMENSLINMQSTVTRIHSQVRQ